MTLKQHLNLYIKQLSFLYPENEIQGIFQILCEDLFNWSRSQYLLNSLLELNHLQEQILSKSLAELKTGKPVQHITCKAHFYGREFKVSSDTLIPRQETEELVQLIIDDAKSKDQLSILDIGTGTGCIPISLSLELENAQVSSMDVSTAALDVARDNASQLHAQVDFIQQDILTYEQLPSQYDIIVSNPPYVRNLEKQEIHKNVLDHEPHLALFVDDNDPLIFYRKILELAIDGLKPDGTLYFEINQYLPQETKSLAEELGFHAQLFKDLNGNYRMMRCRF